MLPHPVHYSCAKEQRFLNKDTSIDAKVFDFLEPSKEALELEVEFDKFGEEARRFAYSTLFQNVDDRVLYKVTKLHTSKTFCKCRKALRNVQLSFRFSF